MRTLHRLALASQSADTKSNASRNPQLYSALSRLAEDAKPSNLTRLATYYGSDTHTLACLGYRLVGDCFLRAFRRATACDCSLKRGAILTPARDAFGAIQGLCDLRGFWLSPPTPHVSNPKRAFLGIHLVESIVEADLLAQETNCCAVALNGFHESAIWSLFPQTSESIILSRPRRAVAA
jgi:hypothetical protein